MPKKKHQSDFDRLLAEIATIIAELRKLNARGGGHTTIHVTEVELKPEQEIPEMSPIIDHMPDMQLPSISVRAKLAVHNPRLANGKRITGNPVWLTSDETQLPLEAIPDGVVQQVDPDWVDPGDGSVAPLIDVLDPDDGLPLIVYRTYANTPLTTEEVEALPEKVAGGVVTFRAGSGVADCDIRINYSDPPLGHVAIVGVEAAEEASAPVDETAPTARSAARRSPRR